MKDVPQMSKPTRNKNIARYIQAVTLLFEFKELIGMQEKHNVCNKN